jgi:hypothetical protein
MAAGSVTLWPQAHPSKPRIDIPEIWQSSPSPLVEFLFFHKAIRAELSRLHQDALAVEQGSEAEITALLNRYHFLRAIYKHHSRAEDEVGAFLSLLAIWNCTLCCFLTAKAL